LGFALLKDLGFIGVKNLSPFYKGQQLNLGLGFNFNTRISTLLLKKSLNKESFSKIQMNNFLRSK
jgi:hypothetical protein